MNPQTTHALWTKLEFNEPFPSSRCSHSATVIGDDIYIIGGGIHHETPTSYFQHHGDIWKVTPKHKELVKLEVNGGDMQPRRGHSAVAYMNRYIVLFGGLLQIDDSPGDNAVLCNELKIFDTVNTQWLKIEQRGEIPDPRRGHLAGIHKDRMIVFGGDTGSIHFGQSVWDLDLSPLLSENQPHDEIITLNWRVLPYIGNYRMPVMLALCATCMIGSKLYIFGGHSFDIENRKYTSSNRLFYFDLETNTFDSIYLRGSWEPESRYCAAMSNIDDNTLIVYGGTAHKDQHPTTILLITLENQKSASWDYVPNTSLIAPGGRNGLILVPNPQTVFHFPDLPVSIDSSTYTPSSTFHPSFILFGGGVFPTQYFNDWYQLDFLLPPKVLVSNLFRPPTNSTQNRQLSNSHLKYFSYSSISSNTYPHLQLHSELSLEQPQPPDLLLSLGWDSEGEQKSIISEIPVHIEILKSGSEYFQLLFSSQWNDTTHSKTIMKSFLYTSTSNSQQLLTLPVIQLYDMDDIEMMNIILTEIYLSYHQYEPFPINSYLLKHIPIEDKCMKLTQILHYLNRFQLIICQYRWELYFFDIFASKIGDELIMDIKICYYGLLTCEKFAAILLPTFIKYYLIFTLRVCSDYLKNMDNDQERQRRIRDLIRTIDEQLIECYLLPIDIKDELIQRVKELKSTF